MLHSYFPSGSLKFVLGNGYLYTSWPKNPWASLEDNTPYLLSQFIDGKIKCILGNSTRKEFLEFCALLPLDFTPFSSYIWQLCFVTFYYKSCL